MTLSNTQLDNIMHDYAKTRRRHLREQQERTNEVYERLPGYRALEQQVPEISLRFALDRAAGHDPGDLHTILGEIAAKKDRMLREAGFPPDYLSLQYTCPLCLDTGYADGIRCECLKKKIRHVLYEQSNLLPLFETNRFDLMREDFLEGEELERFRHAYDVCMEMITGFDTVEGYSNIMFFGSVGSGKSFLSIATAKELLDRGYFVLYFSASELFETLSYVTFDPSAAVSAKSLRDDLYGCDLLIIDDLGTELTNAFVSSQLFSLINERHLKRHATIISTNLELEELRGRYSDRVFSRLISSYNICELTGPDVRLLQRVNG